MQPSQKLKIPIAVFLAPAEGLFPKDRRRYFVFLQSMRINRRGDVGRWMSGGVWKPPVAILPRKAIDCRGYGARYANLDLSPLMLLRVFNELMQPRWQLLEAGFN